MCIKIYRDFRLLLKEDKIALLYPTEIPFIVKI
jgi:hypothetical protein